jgi:subtilisin family serine protease
VEDGFIEERRCTFGEYGDFRWDPVQEYLYVDGPLLAAMSDGGDAEGVLRGRTRPVEGGLGDLGIRWVDVGDQDERMGVLRAAPNTSPQYVFSGEPAYHGGPAGWPVATADRVPAPGDAEAGASVTVAVLDTGFAPTQSYPWLNACCQYDDADREEIATSRAGYLRHEVGHGTFVAGLIAQQAPAATVRTKKVLDANGYVTEVALAAALWQTVDEQVDIVNLSLGGFTAHDRPPRALGRVLDAFTARDDAPVVIAAAGNAGSAREMWPAAADGVIAVGALNADGVPAIFSNFGAWVDVWADGVDIISAFVDYDEAEVAFRRRQTYTGQARWSGTSFAAPRVAGELAAYLAAMRPSNRRDAATEWLASLPPVELGRRLLGQ